MLDGKNLTDSETEVLTGLKSVCENLLKKIEESQQAGSTENTQKVEGITADNVTIENKDDLNAAKEDLENALENFGENYTEEEKAAIKEKLEQISQALESIEKVETVQNAITALPETVEPDDTETGALIEAAKEQYDALTEHLKSLIPNQLKSKLESLLGSLVVYQIIEGNGSLWTVGDDGSVVIIANGPVDKFVGIQVDGLDVDAAQYIVTSGSTVITLKPEFLGTLSVGKHILTVIYSDGRVDGEFEVLEKADTNTPATGDDSNVYIWIALMLVTACGLTGTTVHSIRKKYSK